MVTFALRKPARERATRRGLYILLSMAIWPKEIFRKMPDPRIWPTPGVNDTFFHVTGVSQICLGANPKRVDCDFVNDGDEVIYLARGNEAVIGSGLRLNANGGSYHIGLFNLFLGDIYAISVNPVKWTNLTISEGNKP